MNPPSPCPDPLATAGLPSGLRFASLSHAGLAKLDARQQENLIGVCCIGPTAYRQAASLLDSRIPLQPVHTPLLGHADTEAACHEVWSVDGPPESGRTGDLAYRHNADWLWACLTLDAAVDAVQPDSPTLEKQAATAYRQIFALLDRLDFPHLLRAWNYFPAINAEQGGLERYRQFNVGRQAAFLASGRPVTGNVPTACALGTADGPLSIAILAGKAPLQSLENPRQVSAYHYPQHYGPRSPTFSRAGLIHPAGQPLLMVSGTASIVGHQTLHEGDVAAQTREALANVAILIRQANAARPPAVPPCQAADLCYKAYIRHAADYPVVHDIMRAFAGPDAEIVCVEADICRRALLMEIEATAHFPRPEA